jgi:transcriptional regulator with XRE-family HTH domain
VRRRTPGLRREEVAARAGVSVTWYTWLEQGRGGVPSDDVLERLCSALELDATNREMLFLLAHDRQPPRKTSTLADLTPSLRCLLDSLTVPAFVKTPTFQIIAWNLAAVAVLGDYADVPERERNLLRRIFEPGSEQKVYDLDNVRRACVAAFRVDTARAGQSEEAAALVAELMETSPAFRRLWDEGELRTYAGVRKRLLRPEVGEIMLESSVLGVEGSGGLSIFVYSPVDDASARAVATLIERHQSRDDTRLP